MPSRSLRPLRPTLGRHDEHAANVYVQNDVEVVGELYLSAKPLHGGRLQGPGPMVISPSTSTTRTAAGASTSPVNDLRDFFDLVPRLACRGTDRRREISRLRPRASRRRTLAPSAATLLHVAFGHVESP